MLAGFIGCRHIELSGSLKRKPIRAQENPLLHAVQYLRVSVSKNQTKSEISGKYAKVLFASGENGEGVRKLGLEISIFEEIRMSKE